MFIEKKLKELEINKLLVVDDKEENLSSAKEYFGSLPIEVDYCSSEKSAKEHIVKSATSNKSYDFIMTDLEMENKNSGLEVIREGLYNFMVGVIVTGKNYNRSFDDHHGPATHILPSSMIDNHFSIPGKKDDPEVWKKSFAFALNYYENEKRLRDSLSRFKQYHKNASDELKDLLDLKIETYQ